MSGVNDELITRLRAQAVQLRYRGMLYVADLLDTKENP